MKNLWTANAIIIASSVFVATSCDDDDSVIKAEPLSSSQVTDLNATSSSKYTFFSFEENATVLPADSATSKWDIGFRGTTIILNGGVSGPGAAQGLLMDGIFDELETAPATGYVSDTETAKAIRGSGGWHTYTAENNPQHAILPNAGKILVLKTATGKFVKIEILSYYRGNPSTTTSEFADLATRAESRYYTFRYLYQPDGSENLAATE